MRNIKKSVILSLLCVAVCFFIFLTQSIYAKTERPKAKAQSEAVEAIQAPPTIEDTVASFQKSKLWKKLDDRTQKAWLAAMQQNDPDRRIDCFVRVRAPGDRGDESFLISKGYIVHIFSGTIATGHMKVKDLPDVAKLPFVDAIRLSTVGKDKK